VPDETLKVASRPGSSIDAKSDAIDARKTSPSSVGTSFPPFAEYESASAMVAGGMEAVISEAVTVTGA